MDEIIEKDFYTTGELAVYLEISRIAVFKRIKTGSIKAQKIGRNFVIFKKDIDLENLRSIVKHGVSLFS